MNELDQARAAALANARERDDLLEELDGKRAVVEDVMHQRDQARAEVERLRADLADVQRLLRIRAANLLGTQDQRDTARAEVSRLTAERDGWEPLNASLTRSLDVERAKVERLRGLLSEALDGWSAAGTWSQGSDAVEHAERDRIRREAGLT